ncbi:hypothetical protein ACFQ1M_13585 [Sungkyunkwania multivorans]|uniref:Uncharacterized protein n=1 Tax=Sungkyunkwania multivorans TaxID=1173618 RepID=A0ABW3CZJ9_9FLAO
MYDIEQLYRNDYGIAFFWKKGDQRKKDSVQLVFRDTGFYLNKRQLISFYEETTIAAKGPYCDQCDEKKDCRVILLRTPSAFIDLAVSQNELDKIQDLIRGTLFYLDLQKYLNELCRN